MELKEFEKTIIREELKFAVENYQKKLENEIKGENCEIMVNYYKHQIEYIEDIIKKI